ncbi:MAG: acyl-CoA synthetase [Solirubrobacteraceae bacterium]
MGIFDRHRLRVFAALLRTGMVRPLRPDKALRVLGTLRRWGPSTSSAYMIAGIRYPDRAGLIDDRGTLTFADIDKRSTALANALHERGVHEGGGLAVMCRNHRGFVESTIAAAKLGADLLYLNTEFGAPAIAGVIERERPSTLIYDHEFTNLIADGARDLTRFVASYEPGARLIDMPLDDLIGRASTAVLPPPSRRGRVVILTSGTTGTPKGALRGPPETLEPAASVYSSIPLRALETTVIAAPLFHSWGFAHFMLSQPLSSTLILRRRFDAEEILRAVAQHRASALVVVPVMLQRILELPPETIGRYDVSCLRIIASSGSALPGELATRVMDTFGDVLYNLYGSTEVAWVTIASPRDLRAAPGTAGRPPMGTVVRLLDEDGREVPTGQPGRIFAANSYVFDGYTDGANKDVIAGLTQTGDVGHFDSDGRLFIDGRDDEMIVSGGENVYPREVEDLLSGHDEIEEAAVVGVEDDQFGERLRAFVVPRNGADLTEDYVKDFVKQNLARYKVPRDVVFVNSLPRNATGKVLKRKLQTIE